MEEILPQGCNLLKQLELKGGGHIPRLPPLIQGGSWYGTTTLELKLIQKVAALR